MVEVGWDARDEPAGLQLPHRLPAGWYRRLNTSLGVLVTSLGLAPRDAVTLEVRGRRSGTPRRTPILRTRWQDEDYLVVLAGESEWVRNVRAAGGAAVLRRRGARPVHLVELPPEERPAVIAEYLRRGVERSGRKAAEKQARLYFGVSPDPSAEEIRAVAPYYPVFRVVYQEGGSR